MPYAPRGKDYAEWESLILSADAETVAPGYRFGRYVDPVKPRAVLRSTPSGRLLLAERDMNARGRHYERTSDVAEFVAWDGEGITYVPNTPQSYVLFGASTGHYVQGEALSTTDCLDCILDCERDNPTAIHVGFAFKYDAEMILRDLPTRHWWVLREKSTVRWNGYLITYHPGRVFRVSRKVDGQKITATIYDVFGFFQTSFVKALRAWLDESDLQEIDQIETGKHARGNFTYAQLDDFIKPYWQAELRLLVILCTRLRERLTATDLCPSQWHGAGAVATRVYTKHKTRAHQSRTERDWTVRDKDLATILPLEVNDAARYAYAGGRFELFRLGHYDGTVYQYDINSAYPAAIAKLPSLRDSEWEHRFSPNFDSSLFALWRIERSDISSVGSLYSPGPLPHRDWEGKVAYPAVVSGWYWTPEACLVANDPHTRITEVWICHHQREFPFTWVADYYAERKTRKNNGDPSEKAFKLALNSLYGKMAQRLGYKPGGALPRFHQLEWAGWVTSYTRMQLFAAMRHAGSNLIAVETDAVFSTVPLQLRVGSGLGEWEVTEHAWITYLQSGTYWSDKGAKYRGFDPDSLTHDDAMQWLRQADFATPLVGTTTRFIGSGTGLGSPLHRTWLTESRDLQPGASGKRMHIPETCLACNNGESPAKYLHPLICIARGGTSFPHALPWLKDGSPGVEWQEAYDLTGWDALE